MTVLFMDSADGLDGASRWNTFSSVGILSNVSPSARDAYTLGTSSTDIILYTYATPVSSALTGFYGRITSLANDGQVNAQMVRFNGPTGTTHVALTIDVNGAIHARLGGGAGTNLATSANGIIAVNTWHHWEARCEVADAGGRVVVWIDGVATPVIDFTGDTRNGGSDTTVGQIRLSRVDAGAWHLSDIRIGDGTTPLGVTTVWMSLPNGAGNTTTLTQTPGSGSNFDKVDEATAPDGDTTYVSSSTEGDFDLYTLSDLPSGTWDVLAVQTTLNVKTDDGGAKFVRPVLRSGGSNATGTSQSVPASYLSRMEVFEDNPVTAAAWTQSEVNALEVGPEVRDS